MCTLHAVRFETNKHAVSLFADLMFLYVTPTTLDMAIAYNRCLSVCAWMIICALTNRRCAQTFTKAQALLHKLAFAIMYASSENINA